MYFVYLSTKSIGTTASKICHISESIARTRNTEVNADALRESIKQFVESFKCLRKNIGRNWEKIVGSLDHEFSVPMRDVSSLVLP